MASTDQQPKDITAILNYTQDNGITPWLYDRPLTKHDKHTTKFYVPIEPVEVTVHDARGRTDLTLDASSFEFVNQTTSLSPEDFYTNVGNKIENLYYPEMESFLEQKLGAAKVIIFNHQVRNEVKSGSKGGSVGGYARGIHVDYTASWAEDRFCNLLRTKFPNDEPEIAKLSKGRFVLLNAWRSISYQPIQQDTLAVCHERSVVKPEDYIASDFYGKESSGKQIRMASRHASKHQWFYCPLMTRDDVLLMKMYDSDTTKAARSCFHTAFTDPTAPDDAPARESIEIRAVAFFPDHEPNTCPPVGTTSSATTSYITANDAATRIRATIENLFLFPLPVQWMYRYAMRSGRSGAAAVIRMLLSDPGNRLGLQHASDSVKAEATSLLLQDDKFANKAEAMKQRLEQAIAERRRQNPWFWRMSPRNW